MSETKRVKKKDLDAIVNKINELDVGADVLGVAEDVLPMLDDLMTGLRNQKVSPHSADDGLDPEEEDAVFQQDEDKP